MYVCDNVKVFSGSDIGAVVRLSVLVHFHHTGIVIFSLTKISKPTVYYPHSIVEQLAAKEPDVSLVVGDPKTELKERSSGGDNHHSKPLVEL